MKKLTMFILEDCPYCIEARRWIAEIKREEPRFAELEIELIDEEIQKEFADSMDYYYVPTFYCDGEKLFEGAMTKDIVRKCMEKAL